MRSRARPRSTPTATACPTTWTRTPTATAFSTPTRPRGATPTTGCSSRTSSAARWATTATRRKTACPTFATSTPTTTGSPTAKSRCSAPTPARPTATATAPPTSSRPRRCPTAATPLGPARELPLRGAPLRTPGRMRACTSTVSSVLHAHPSGRRVLSRRQLGEHGADHQQPPHELSRDHRAGRADGRSPTCAWASASSTRCPSSRAASRAARATTPSGCARP
jgi:hypothetical protein